MNKSTFLILLLIGAGCSQRSADDHTGEDNSYSLRLVDSFEVANMTKVQITDYSEDEGIYLAFSEAENDLLELDVSGKILKRVNRAGEGPNAFGRYNPLGLSFGGAGERLLQVPFGLIAYDTTYQVMHRHTIISPLPVRANVPIGKTHFFQSDDTRRYLVGPTTFLSAHLLIYDEVGKDTLQNFLLLEPASGGLRSVVPYETDSYYKKTEHLYYGLMGKSFFVDGDHLVVLHNLADEILVYDCSDELRLVQKVPIHRAGFQVGEPLPIGIGHNDPRIGELTATSGRNMKIFRMDDGLWLMSYYQGVSKARYHSLHSEEEPFSFMKQKERLKMLVFENGRQVDGELDMPDGTLMFSLPGNRLLVQEKPDEDVEEEVTRYQVYELAKDLK